MMVFTGCFLNLQVHHLLLQGLSTGVEVPLLYSKCTFSVVNQGKHDVHKSTLRIRF